VSTRDWLAERPFTLCLSAGFFGFFAHTGLLAALEEAGLRPARVVGVSAGALAGGLWASGLPAAALEEQLVRLRRAEFWDPGLPLGGLLAGQRFSRKLLDVLAPTGVRRVEETRVPFTPVVHDVLRWRPIGLAAGALDLAIRASCAVPFMFRPVRLDGRVLLDGGILDRPGLTALRPGERVLLHHLPSRARPDAAPPAAPPGVEARVLVVSGLPRVTPFALERGREALERARAHARAWLAAPAAVGA
jgi:NTE family protein